MAWSLTEQEFDNVRHLLPDGAIDLIQVVGADAAYRMIKRWGGTSLPVGMNKTRNGKILHANLAEEIGEENALKIGRLFGKQRFLWVPKCQDALREVRNRKIRAQIDDLTMRGSYSMPEAVRKIAVEYNLTDRQIWYIAKQTDIDASPQMALI
ncbi:Mor transcription activator family protein [Neisseria montereyensis]|uniref:Mor transcription activator domain-containing protein n=1 Tax=Neisseria montereyensis TaxID=2973938 RepID=A0ABT2FDH0_9NEIS|nr:Mor transcription activator family protein [Neisseria montereyensis]MCS4534261.1 hypothetical protein [Neisseria montereyensis]